MKKLFLQKHLQFFLQNFNQKLCRINMNFASKKYGKKRKEMLKGGRRGSTLCISNTNANLHYTLISRYCPIFKNYFSNRSNNNNILLFSVT